MREKVNGFVGVMAVAILCMVSGLCMVWGIAPVVLAVYVAACAVCGRYMITCIGCPPMPNRQCYSEFRQGVYYKHSEDYIVLRQLF